MDSNLEHKYFAQVVNSDLDDTLNGGGRGSLPQDGDHGRWQIPMFWLSLAHKRQVCGWLRYRPKIKRCEPVTARIVCLVIEAGVGGRDTGDLSK